MKKVRSFFNKYAIENLMTYIIAGNVIVFVLDAILSNRFNFSLASWLTLNPIDLFSGQVWRLFTFVFVLPELGTGFFDMILWNVMVCYFYHWIGSSLEGYYGAPRFNMMYLSGVLCCWVFCALSYVFNWFAPSWFVFSEMSSSLLNTGLFLAFATLFPEVQIRIFFIIPIKVKWLGIIHFALLVLEVFNSVVFGDILMAMTALAVLTNYFIWFGKEWAERGWILGKNKVRKAQYKSKIVKVKAKNVTKNYRHKCCVCGKTDESHPNMQFRYCVKCSGLKEYCMDHINNHTHE